MAEGFVELGATTVDHLTDKYWDTAYDKVRSKKNQHDSKKENRRYKNQLPSPERDPQYDQGTERGTARDDSLERESLRSERIIKAYENEPDDPRRKVDPRIEDKRRRDSARMSNANGYGYDSRARSQGPARSRYDDDGDSDYDDREGRRYKSSGRGYDDRDDRDYPYDREVIETERYRGVSTSLCISIGRYTYISRD